MASRIVIVCTNCGEPWTDNHADECEFRLGVWLEAQAILLDALAGGE